MHAYRITTDGTLEGFVTRAGYQTLPIKMFSSIQWEISPVLAAISSMLTLASAAICLLVVAARRNEQRR